MFTNAQHNRKQAMRLLKAGFTPAEIVAEYPLVWRLRDGLLGMKYNAEATACLHRTNPEAADRGIKETNVTMTTESVNALLATQKG